MLTQTLSDLECVKVPVPSHQSLPLTTYVFGASYIARPPCSRLRKFRAWSNQNS